MDLETESEANFRKRFVLILTLACGVLFFALVPVLGQTWAALVITARGPAFRQEPG